MKGLKLRLVGWALAVAGLAILMSPVRPHRAVWQVTVGASPPETRFVGGGEFVAPARVLVEALRNGDRRTDAEFRAVLGIVLIASGLGAQPDSRQATTTARIGADLAHLSECSLYPENRVISDGCAK